MLTFFDPLRELTFPAMLLRVFLACFCGAMIGLERSAKNRSAGFRTHILVCLAAAAAAMTGIYFFVGLKLPADVTRISASIVSGLGFIGAGAIVITKKLTIKGLTTAAGLWTTGIIGLAFGSGYYELGLLGTVLVLAAETLMGLGAKTIKKRPEYTMEVLYDDKDALDKVLRFCKDSGMEITSLKIHTLGDAFEADYAAEIAVRGDRNAEHLIPRVQVIPGVVSAVTEEIK